MAGGLDLTRNNAKNAIQSEYQDICRRQHLSFNCVIFRLEIIVSHVDKNEL